MHDIYFQNLKSKKSRVHFFFFFLLQQNQNGFGINPMKFLSLSLNQREIWTLDFSLN